ncbi:MAG: hypothetical protein N3A38_11680 [Planctomycetota bacterium]|nr:hypothetical protein [Planctomycetota bacterium]
MLFVLHHHTGWKGRLDHYDLMLQMEEAPVAGGDARVLMTFATAGDEVPIPSSPDGRPEAAGSKVLLRRIEDHRAVYLGFEGEVSGGRGRVRIVDRGALSWRSAPFVNRVGDAGAAWRAPGGGQISFRLDGRLLRGEFRLVPIGGGLYEFERCHEDG